MFLPGAELLKAVKNLDGEDMKWSGSGKEKPLTVQQAIRLALTGSLDDEKVKGDDKFKYFNLAKKIMDAKEAEDLELSAEEVTLIKERVGKFWGAELVGYVYNVLEAKYPTKEDKA